MNQSYMYDNESCIEHSRDDAETSQYEGGMNHEHSIDAERNEADKVSYNN